MASDEHPPSAQSSQGRPPRQAARLRQSPAKARLFGLFGRIWVAVVVVLDAINFLPAVVLLFPGFMGLHRSRRHQVKVLRSLDAVPADEKIVLFLRSFKDDEGFARLRAEGPPTPLATNLTEEEQLARAVSSFGRMVALGKPDDTLPHTGADRSYPSDEEWKTQVLAGLDRANLVLLAAGPGESLVWEVKQVIAHGLPQRLVLVVSHSAEQYESFATVTRELFPKGLPDHPPQARVHKPTKGPYVRAGIWFEADWTPHLEMLDDRFSYIAEYHHTEFAFPLAMRKIYNRAGLPLRQRDVPSPGRHTRPWAIPLSVMLLAALPAADIIEMVLAHRFTDLPETFGFAALLSVPLYRVWRGGRFVTRMMAWMGLCFGAVFVLGGLMGSFIDRRLLVSLLPMGAVLTAGGGLLFRGDVRAWVEDEAAYTEPATTPRPSTTPPTLINMAAETRRSFIPAFVIIMAIIVGAAVQTLSASNIDVFVRIPIAALIMFVGLLVIRRSRGIMRPRKLIFDTTGVRWDDPQGAPWACAWSEVIGVAISTTWRQKIKDPLTQNSIPDALPDFVLVRLDLWVADPGAFQRQHPEMSHLRDRHPDDNGYRLPLGNVTRRIPQINEALSRLCPEIYRGVVDEGPSLDLT